MRFNPKWIAIGGGAAALGLLLLIDRSLAQGNPPQSVTDVAVWHGQVEFSLTGNWGHKDKVSSSNHTVSRTGSALFRCSRRTALAAGKVRWTSSFDEPLDRIVVQGRVDDDWYETDQDHDKTGNVYSRSNTHGGGLGPGRVGVSVEIDPQARTYQISGSDVRVGPSVHRHWVEPNGKTDPPRSGFVTVKLIIGPRPLPAPDATGAITDTIDVPVEGWSYVTPNDLTADPKHCKGKITVTLTPLPFKLQAKISGPPVVYRGDPVTLDGSGSTGDIASYQWSFVVDPKCPAATKDVHPTGEVVEFAALWGFKAILEVTDKSGNKAKAEHHVDVRPRDGWEVAFTSKKDKDLPFPAWPMFANSADVAKGVLVQSEPKYAKWLDIARAKNTVGGLHIGVNHCSCEDPEVVTSHWIHTSIKTPKKYRYEGYDLILLRDDGPFSGLVYVQSQKLKIDRRERVNEALRPGGEVGALNARRHTAAAAASLLSLGLAHEETHTKLLRKGLTDLQAQDKDPAKLIEAMFGEETQALEDKVDKTIWEAETAIGTASTEDKVQAELAGKFPAPLRIWLPTSLKDADRQTIETDKDLGPLYAIGDK